MLVEPGSVGVPCSSAVVALSVMNDIPVGKFVAEPAVHVAPVAVALANSVTAPPVPPVVEYVTLATGVDAFGYVNPFIPFTMRAGGATMSAALMVRFELAVADPAPAVAVFVPSITVTVMLVGPNVAVGVP